MYRRIRDLRTDNDMTQSELAKLLGMSQTGYSKYETGENDIPTQILIKLARIYNTSIDYLLDQTNCKSRYKQTPLPYSDRGVYLYLQYPIDHRLKTSWPG